MSYDFGMTNNTQPIDPAPVVKSTRDEIKYWQQRAEAAEAKLRALEMQEPYGYWIQHPYTANVRFSKVAPDTQVMAMSQHIVTPLYAKPFPAPKQEEK